MAFDETLEPVAPELVGRLDGAGVSLARDPVEGSLLCLVRARDGDYVILELSRAWLRGADVPQQDPPVLFSLREWVTKLEEGRVAPGEIPFALGELAQKMSVLRIDNLDFLSLRLTWLSVHGSDGGKPRPQVRARTAFAPLRRGRRRRRGRARRRTEPMIRIHAWRERVPGL